MRLESVPNYCIINHSNLHITVFNEGCLLHERFHISHILKVIFFNSVECFTIQSVNSSSYLFCGKSACLWESPLCDVTKGSEDSLKLSCISDNTPSLQPPCYFYFFFFSFHICESGNSRKVFSRKFRSCKFFRMLQTLG